MFLAFHEVRDAVCVQSMNYYVFVWMLRNFASKCCTLWSVLQRRQLGTRPLIGVLMTACSWLLVAFGELLRLRLDTLQPCFKMLHSSVRASAPATRNPIVDWCSYGGIFLAFREVFSSV